MPKKRPYDQTCPIARALDSVGDRWSILIVRELFLGPTRYGELLDALESISTDVLAKRLRELEAAAVIVAMNDGRYELTGRGRSLAPVLHALGHWGSPLLTPPVSADALTATRALQMLVIPAAGVDLSPEQVTELRIDDQRFAVSAGPDGLVAHRGPTPDADATVTTDSLTLWGLGSGQLTWADAINSGAVTVDGDTSAAEKLVARHLS